MGREIKSRAQATRKRPQKASSAEKETLERVTPGKVPARIRGWILQDFISVELRHITESGATRVHRWKLQGEGGPENADELSHEIMIAAQEDAEALGGYQRYGIFAFDSADPGAHHVSRALFEVRSDSEVGEDTSPTEEASPKGIAAQLMRHLEVTQRTMANMFSDVVGMQHQALKAAQDRLSHYEARAFEQFELTEKLASAEHERIIAQRQEERKDLAVDKMLGLVGTYAPIIANRFLSAPAAGKALPPRKEALAEPELKKLLEKLLSQGPKLAALGSVLSPQELSILSELHAALMNAKGEPSLIEEIVCRFLSGFTKEKLDKVFQIFDEEEKQLFAHVFSSYGKREAAKTNGARAS